MNVLNSLPSKPRLVLAFISLLVIGGFISGCNEDNQWDAEYNLLSARNEQWNNQFDSLNEKIDSLWDVTSDVLAENIPADFPEIDRDIFIRARNADHIAMFMSFKKLDTTLQALVAEAGRKDAQLAAEMRQLHLGKNTLEHDIAEFLQRIAHSDPDASRRYAAQFSNSIAAHLQ